MNLDRIRLARILDTLKLACGNKVMDVSYYVKFVVDKDNHAVYLNTTDFHTFLVIDFGDVALTTLDDVPEVFLIKFKQLHDLVKYSTTEDVAMSYDESNGWVVVHGHSPTDAPDRQPNRIGVDTGACYGGNLTCLVLEDEDQRFLQA